MTETSSPSRSDTTTRIWVLIVEDDQSHRQVLSDLVLGEGYHPMACGSAAEALRVIDTRPFVVAILDQRLPDVSGTDLLQKLRQRGKDLRVIIHTGYGSFESARDAVNFNAFAYVEKLSNPEQLISQLHRAVQDHTAEALRRSESELTSVMEHAPDVICRLDRHGIIEFINHGEPGAESEQVVGSPAEDWIDPSQRLAFRRALESVLMTGRAQAIEIQSTNSGRWYSCHLGPIRENDRSESIIFIAHEITDRKAAEITLRRHQEELEQRVHQRTAELRQRESQERWFHEKLTCLSLVSNRLTSSSTVTELCRNAVELGCQAMDLDRMRICLYDPGDNRLRGTWGIDEQGRLRDESSYAQPLPDEQRQGVPGHCCIEHDVELTDPAGQPVGRGSRCTFWMFEGDHLFGRIFADNLLTGNLLTDNHCELLSLYAGTLAHLIRRIRAEARASRHHEALSRVSRLATLGEMATGFAHELNQPLSAIVNFIQGTIRRVNSGRLDQAELNQVLARTADQALRAGKIIQRLRGFVRPQEAGGEAVNLQQAIHDSLGLLEGQLAQAGVRTRVSCPDPAPSIRGDTIQIEQVLINLILNAIDAMDRTELAHRLLTIRVLIQGDHVHVRLTDRGCGLPPQTTPIFEPFISTKPNGMGMGLSISRSIIQAHRGELFAKPSPSGGAEFICVLPIVENKDKTDADERPG